MSQYYYSELHAVWKALKKLRSSTIYTINNARDAGELIVMCVLAKDAKKVPNVGWLWRGVECLSSKRWTAFQSDVSKMREEMTEILTSSYDVNNLEDLTIFNRIAFDLSMSHPIDSIKKLLRNVLSGSANDMETWTECLQSFADADDMEQNELMIAKETLRDMIKSHNGSMDRVLYKSIQKVYM
jgi:hypothetical protein